MQDVKATGYDSLCQTGVEEDSRLFLAFISDVSGPLNQPVFVPGTKMKLRARGFEIVCGFVPEFVPNAYAKSRGGIRRQDSQAQQPNWS